MYRHFIKHGIVLFGLFAGGLSLARLEGIPVIQNVFGPFQLGIAKDVWVTQDKYLHNAGGNFIDREITLLITDRAVKDDLKQQIAEFLLKVCGVAGLFCL